MSSTTSLTSHDADHEQVAGVHDQPSAQSLRITETVYAVFVMVVGILLLATIM